MLDAVDAELAITEKGRQDTLGRRRGSSVFPSRCRSVQNLVSAHDAAPDASCSGGATTRAAALAAAASENAVSDAMSWMHADDMTTSANTKSSTAGRVRSKAGVVVGVARTSMSDILARAEQEEAGLLEERKRASMSLESAARHYLSAMKAASVAAAPLAFKRLLALLKFKLSRDLHLWFSSTNARLAAQDAVQTITKASSHPALASDCAALRDLTISTGRARAARAAVTLINAGTKAVPQLMRGPPQPRRDAANNISGSKSSGSGGGAAASSAQAAKKAQPPRAARASFAAAAAPKAAAARRSVAKTAAAAAAVRKAEGKRNRLPRAAVDEMRAWLNANWHAPTPTPAQKMHFVTTLGITKTQVENWFINARMRIWRPTMAATQGDRASIAATLEHCSDSNVYKQALISDSP